MFHPGQFGIPQIFPTDVYYATWFRPDLQKAFTGKVA